MNDATASAAGMQECVVTDLHALSAIPDKVSQVEALIFEYMATTQGERGLQKPTKVDQLPEVLRTECTGLLAAYQFPGTLLLASKNNQLIGCVGLKPSSQAGSIEVAGSTYAPPIVVTVLPCCL